ncbi:Gfo/Idh/MocA family protein [Granulicella cerasi]|uniref:Gfo/Idh/MocA family protein n=1 Tax=Granulicella cerasi TaxID=741063 RepID=A0ABW1ZC23_9BACT
MRVGIIGASFAKAAFLPAFRHVPGAEVVALASSRLESAEAAAKPYGIQHVYTDWQKMLAEHQFDLVCIATPTVTHAPMVLAALEAGAHVLSEKPTAMDATEAAAMLAKAEELGRVHMIDHELRFNAKRRKLHELVHSGTIGEVRHAVVHNVGEAGPIRHRGLRATGGRWPRRAVDASARTDRIRWTCCVGGWGDYRGLRHGEDDGAEPHRQEDRRGVDRDR